MAGKKSVSTTSFRSKRLILCIYAPYNNMQNPNYYCDEFRNLVKTAGIEYDEEFFCKLRTIDKTYFLTKGKRQELEAFCEANEIEQVVCSELFTPLQERNLENLLDCPIMDREHLILEIFQNAAHTAEGKVQVEIARIEFLKTRMAGNGREFAQQEGRIGSKGPGETAKESLKRFFDDRLRQSKKRFINLKKSREIQRKRRLESKIPLACLVGYTNAGKSSLLNILTKSNVLTEEKLFATLDTTTRELFLSNNGKILVSDTVGFISQLPHHLIEAFKATLEELQYANLLLHVTDISNHAWKNHINVVNKTLKELSVTGPMLYVFNKADKLSKDDKLKLKSDIIEYEPNVVIHTRNKNGIKVLVDYLSKYHFEK